MAAPTAAPAGPSTPSAPPATAADVLAAVDPQLDAVRSRAAEAGELRRLPADLAAALAATGINRLVLPVELGGLEAWVDEVMDVTEAIAAADGSTGWCAAIGAGSNVFSGHLPEPGARRVFADVDQANATMLAPAGRLTIDAVPHGAPDQATGTLRGRWPLTSGHHHSRWAGLGAMVERGGQTEPMPVVAFVPLADLRVEDTWDSDGLRATGSDDVIAHDLVVPADQWVAPPRPSTWAAGPFWRLPLPTTLVPMLVAVPLGIARGALDHVVASLGEGRSPRRGALADDLVGLTDLAEADAALRAARAGVRATLADARARVEAGDPVPRRLQARIALACHHACDVATTATTTAHRLVGSVAARRPHPLLRALADVHAARQHLLFARQHRPHLARIAVGAAAPYPTLVI